MTTQSQVAPIDTSGSDGALATLAPVRFLASASEVGVALGLSRPMVYNLVNAGIIPKPGKVGARSLWRISDIEAVANRIAAGEVEAVYAQVAA